MLKRLHLRTKVSRIRTRIKYFFLSLAQMLNPKKRRKAQTIKRVLIITSGIFIGLFLVWFFLLRGGGAAAWYSDNWEYRTEYTFDGPEDTNKKVFVSIDTSALIAAGKMQADCGDSRFSDSKGNELQYYIDSSNGACDTNDTHYYILVSDFNTSSTSIFHYYGSSQATNGTQVSQFSEENYPQATGGTITSVGSDVVHTFTNSGTFTPEISTNVQSLVVGGGGSGGGHPVIDRTGGGGGAGGVQYSASVAITPQDYTISVGVGGTYNSNGQNSSALGTTSTGGGYGADGAFGGTVGNGGSGGGSTHRNLGIYGTGIAGQGYRGGTSGYDSGNGTSGSFAASGGGGAGAVGNNGSSSPSIHAGDGGVGIAYDISGVSTYYGGGGGGGVQDLGQGGTAGNGGLGGGGNGAVNGDGSNATPNTGGGGGGGGGSGNGGSGGSGIVIVRYTIVSTQKHEEQRKIGPAAYWRLDDGYSTSVNDSSGNGNTGSLGTGSSAPSWKAEDFCVSGKCLQFDGTDDVMTVPSTVTSIKTVGFWTKPITTTEYFIDLNGSASISVSAGTLSATGFTSPTIYINGVPGTTVTANAWHYVTVTTATGISGSAIKVGQISTNHLQGFMDEVKVYPYVRTADEIKQDYLFASVKGSSVVLGADNQSFLSQGLVGYWNMEGIGTTGGGVTILDRSGNSNDGTTSDANNSGMNCSYVGKYGGACDLDGTDDNISLGSGSTIDDLATDEFSVQAWVYLDTAPVSNDDQEVIISKGDSTDFKWHLSVRNNSGSTQYNATLNNIAVSRSANTTIVGGWHHVVMTYNDNTDRKIHIYIDGAEPSYATQIAMSGSYSSDASKNLTIGSHANGSGYWDGSVDEVRIYNRALSVDEVKSLYEWVPGPIAYYAFDEGIGTTTVSDKSGNGNDLDMTDLTEDSWLPGKYGSSLYFRGDDANDELSNGSILNNLPNGDFTTSFWFNWNADGSMNWDVPIGKRGYSPGGWWIEYEATNRTIALQADFGTTDLSYLSASNVYSFNQWTYATVVFRSATNTAEFYINGVKVNYGNTTQAGVGTYQDDSSNTFRVGRDNEGGQRWKGMLDDIRIYNYARTKAQILQDMNAGHPSVGTPVGSTVLHLRMDEGYGTTVNDSSPQGNNGTLGTGSSAPTWTNDGKFGKGLSFDGNDYIDVGSPTSLETIPITVSLWLKPSVISGQLVNYFISKFSDDDGVNDKGWAFGFVGTYSTCNGVDGTPYLYETTTNTWVCATTAMTTGNWYHLAFSNDGTTTKIYVNGKLESSSAQTWTEADASNLRIGVRSDFQWYYSGAVDEVKIYPLVLTAEQVSQEYQGGKAMVLGAGNTGVGGSSPSNAASRENCIPGDATTCNSPVLELNFEEATGQTAYDTSTNGNNGTLGSSGSADSADPVWGIGPDHMAGSALNFDGADDYVTTADIDLTTKTITAWVKLDVGSNTFHKIVSKRVGYTDNPGSFEVDTTAGDFRLVYGWNQAAHYTAVSSISEGVWQFIAVTHNPGVSAPIFYINGKPVSSSSWFGGTPGNVNNNAAWYIGSAPEQDTFSKGTIDQVKIYDYVRTPAQIAWEYSKGAPIAHYRLDECQGTTANNSAFTPTGTAGNNGTITAGSSGNTTVGTCTSGSGTEMWANGASGQWEASLDFDEVDDRLVIPDMELGQEFTVSFWFNSVDNSGTGYQYMYSHGTIQTANSLNIYFNEDSNAINTPGTILVSIMDSNDGIPLLSQDVETQIGLSDSTWHHLVVTVTSTGTKAYIDGVQQISYTNGNNGINPSGSIYIGARNDLNSTRFYDGKLDDVRIYNYPLTTTQIKELYKGGAVVFK